MSDAPDEQTPRRDLYDTLFMVGINAEISRRYLEAGDDTGLVYSLRRLRGHVVQAIGDLKRIQDLADVATVPSPADVTFVERLAKNSNERSAA